MELSEQEAQVVTALHSLVANNDLELLSQEEINTLIYDEVIRGTSSEPKKAFKVIYQKLIGKDKGPRLPSWLKEIDKQRLLKLLTL